MPPPAVCAPRRAGGRRPHWTVTSDPGRPAGDTRPGQWLAAATADTRGVPPGGRGTRRWRETPRRARQRGPPLTRDPLTPRTPRTPTLTHNAEKCRPWTAKEWPGPPPPSTHNHPAGDAAPGQRARGTQPPSSRGRTGGAHHGVGHTKQPCRLPPPQNPLRAARVVQGHQGLIPPVPPRCTGP